MHRDGKQVLSHAGIYLVARGLPGIIAFLAIPIFTRLMSPDEYGRYALVVAAASLLNALFYQWLRLSMVRFLPAHEADPARLKSTLMGLTCFLNLVTGALGGIACLLPIGNEWRGLLLAGWVVLALQGIFDLCCEHARAMLRPWQYMVMQIARSGATVALGATLVIVGAGWWGPLAGTAAGMALAAAWALRRDWGGPPRSREAAKDSPRRHGDTEQKERMEDGKSGMRGGAAAYLRSAPPWQDSLLSSILHLRFLFSVSPCLRGKISSRLRLTIDRELLVKICQYGVPLSLTVALAAVIFSSDRFLIAGFLGESAAGLYSVAVDFTSQTLTLLMMVISLAIFPLAVRAWEQHGREAAQEKMRSNAALLLAVGVPCVIGLTVLAPGISHCFLGQRYRTAAAGIIPLVALGSFLAGLKAYHFDAAFQFVHRTIIQVWIVLFAAGVNLGLNVVMIPRWGINGAAVASVLAYAVSIMVTAWIGRRYFELPFPPRPCAQVLLAGGAMGLVLFPCRQQVHPLAVTAQIVAGALVYGGVLVACNFLDLRAPLLRKAQRLINRRKTARAEVVEAIGAGEPV
jgi:O-antigen/teichoic acid export membrane protein